MPIDIQPTSAPLTALMDFVTDEIRKTRDEYAPYAVPVAMGLSAFALASALADIDKRRQQRAVHGAIFAAPANTLEHVARAFCVVTDTAVSLAADTAHRFVNHLVNEMPPRNLPMLAL